MGPLMIVKVKIGGQASRQFRHRGVVLEVDVLIFEATPQAFDEDIVQSSTTTIHTDVDGGAFQTSRELIGGELRTLIRVKDNRSPLAECLLECIQAEVTIERVGELPRQDIAAKPVDDGD